MIRIERRKVAQGGFAIVVDGMQVFSSEHEDLLVEKLDELGVEDAAIVASTFREVDAVEILSPLPRRPGP